jgi:cytochrome bd-type quinol oxidase subunit 1
MLALIGFILGIVAAVLKLQHGNGDTILWLVIFGVILGCAEMVFGWYRGGYYGRRNVP